MQVTLPLDDPDAPLPKAPDAAPEPTPLAAPVAPAEAPALVPDSPVEEPPGSPPHVTAMAAQGYRHRYHQNALGQPSKLQVIHGAIPRFLSSFGARCGTQRTTRKKPNNSAPLARPMLTRAPWVDTPGAGSFA
jgi:hypothetical protein